MNRQVKPEDSKRIEKLYTEVEEKRFLSVFLKSDKTTELCSLLREISSVGAIRQIAPFVLHGNAIVQKAAIEKVCELYQLVPGEELSWLDESMRSSLYKWYNHPVSQNWKNLTPSKIDNLDLQGSDLNTFLLLLSCHGNGYVREAALKKLHRLDEKLAAKIAFVRANDWIENIRKVATTILNNIISKSPPKEVVSYLLFVDQLKGRSRQDHQYLVRDFERRLSVEDGKNALANAVATENFRVARMAFNLARKTYVEKSPLINTGIKHADPLIRSLSMKLMLDEYLGDELLEGLLLLCSDSYAPLRKRAIFALVEKFPNEIYKPLLPCLGHKNKGLREVAKFYLEKHKLLDVANYYREQLARAEISEGVVLGLAQFGDASDWVLIQQFESHSLPRVRAAVITASAMMVEKPVGWYFNKMEIGCPAEFAAAKKAILNMPRMESSKLLKLHSKYRFCKTGAFIRLLLTRNDQWIGLAETLDTLCQSKNLDAVLIAEVHAWLDRYDVYYWYVKPSEELLSQLNMLVENLDTNVSDLNFLTQLKKLMKRISDQKV